MIMNILLTFTLQYLKSMMDSHNLSLEKRAKPVCVCNQLFIDRYMWPEGPWQRLTAALADSSGVLLDHILSQIEMIDPSRAPLFPVPKSRRAKPVCSSVDLYSLLMYNW